jgi:hypothetical protein
MMKYSVLSLLLGASLIPQIQSNINGFHYANHKHTPEYLEKVRAKYSKTNEDHTYIHLIPHTHDDVGWLKTIDMYYSGANN